MAQETLTQEIQEGLQKEVMEQARTEEETLDRREVLPFLAPSVDLGPTAHLDAHKLKVTTEGGGITVTFKVASPNPEEVMGLMHLALAGKARVYLRPLQYEMAPPEKTEALDQEDQVGIGSQFDAVEGCGCHAVDGEDHNMMVCDKHFREGIAEARRLFPDWPEDDLVTEGRRIAMYGLPPATD